MLVNVAVTLLLVNAAPPAGDPSAEVDRLMRREMKSRHIPGAVVAVVHRGKVVKRTAYGLANVELGARCRIDNVFEIGSVTKQFTATLVMMLVEDGRVKLDQSVKDLLPAAPDLWKGITVRHLLGHTSGLRNINDLKGFELREKLDGKSFVDRLKSEPLEFEPGEKYAYRNTGYALAGYIVERVCGKPYWEVLRDRIFLPLKMASSGDRAPEKILRGRSAGYEWEAGKLVNRGGDLTDIFAAGAIASTVGDLIKWNAAIDSCKLLKKQSIEAMHVRGTLSDGKKTNYGLGWGVGEYRGVRLISHGGSTAGFSASISKFVDQDVTVIVLTNLGTPNNATDLARAVAAEYVKFPQ